jgi:hypothetical protein
VKFTFSRIRPACVFGLQLKQLLKASYSPFVNALKKQHFIPRTTNLQQQCEKTFSTVFPACITASINNSTL